MTASETPTRATRKRRRPHGPRPRRWREHRFSPIVNLSWMVSALFFFVLIPIRDASSWSYVAAALWVGLNLVITVSMRSSLEVGTPGKEAEEVPEEVPEEAPEDDAEGVVAGTSLLRDAMRRLRQNQLATLCIGLLTLLIAVCFLHRLTYEIGSGAEVESAFFADHIDHTKTNKENTFSSPTRTHWFGTDSLGRDVFARTAYGGSISFLVALVGTVVSLAVGVAWGSIAGYLGGRVDHYMMRIVDVLYGLPFLFLVILIMTLVNGVHATATAVRPHIQEVERLTLEGKDDEAAAYAVEHGVDFNAHAAVFLNEKVPPIVVMFFALGLVQWLTMARIVRGQVLSLREREFVVAARLLGASTSRILLRHIIPNLLGPIIIYTTLTIPTIMLLEAFLSFLGLGISEPDCSWGSLASEGIAAINPIKTYWWLLAYPAGAICLALFSLNFAGDGLRDALDPRRRQ